MPAQRKGRPRHGLTQGLQQHAVEREQVLFGGRPGRGATLMQYPAWIGGTILGVLVAPPTHLVETLGLDLVFPAYFLVLLLDELRTSRQARRAAAASATLTGALLFALPAGLALLGSTAAALLGLRSFPRKTQR
ncbi:MAG: hypothetical protein ACRDN9_05590 [Streptosporangiaceae bacterium]